MPMPTPFTIIVVIDAARGIGRHNTLPWRLSEDLAHFKRLTTGHTIIMGRKTFDSIGRPLPNRRSIVITRNPDWRHDGVESAPSLAAALQMVEGQAFVIGGAQIYIEALPQAERLVVTEIAKTFECDAHFPPIDPGQWRETARETHHSEGAGFDYAFVTYEKR